MTGWMEGQVALVTGGGSGIGRAVVDAYIAEGAHVGVLEISAAKAEALIADHGEKVCVTVGDASTLDANQQMIAATREAFGAIDTLACVAGIWDCSVSLLDMPADKMSAAFDEMFAVNVKAILFAAKAAAEELVRNNGSIILTASTAAFNADGGGALYTSSKYAVRGLVQQLAFELAPKVRVNGVAPGGTITKLGGLKALDQGAFVLDAIEGIRQGMATDNPLRFAATPQQHASAYVYLAARDRSAAVTGTIIGSDGGMGVRGIGRLSGL